MERIKTMKLCDLKIENEPIDLRFAEVTLTGLSADSRRVKRGDLFFAISGSKDDGIKYIGPAIAAGAAAIVSQQSLVSIVSEVPVIKVENCRRALALAAAQFYPQQPRTIAAVTGTSGKTSVVAFTRQIYKALGYLAASIGTVGVVTPNWEDRSSLTTPDPIKLHQLLDLLAKQGVTHLALEASSHGLKQHRLDGVNIEAAAFTNISRDHLDYHPTFEDYLKSKLMLFELARPGAAAIIAIDNPQADKFVEVANQRDLRCFTIGRNGRDIRLVASTIEGFGQRLAFEYAGCVHKIYLPLVGAFQVENALIAAGIAIAGGGNARAVFSALEHLEGAKGRLDFVGEKNGAPIFVDYAHKPDALANVLDALRPYAKRRLTVVFGCGGDRDKGKRPIMGAIAAKRADRVIITDDNPRSEDPAKIRSAIIEGAPHAIEIDGRAEAISQAIAELQNGDVLLIAGKGHETTQEIKGEFFSFSDHDVVSSAIENQRK